MKVLVPEDLGVKILDESADIEPVRYAPGDPWPSDHLDATTVVVGYESAAAVGARFVELPNLRLVQTLNAGYDQWLPLLPDGVMLSNGRGAHGGSSAEWVVAVLLAIYRDLQLFNDQQDQGVWRAKSTETLIGKRVVVLGAGDLAVNLASRLTPFDTEVTLVGRRARPGVHPVTDLDDLLPTADVVVAMLPAHDSTYHIIDAGFLAKLRDGAVVVNVGRGGAVDTEALLAELTSGRLRAALDVTEPEPLPADHPLWSAPGLVLTPHVAGSTTGAWERAWAIAREQIEVYVAGDRPPNLVAGPGAPQD
ncbi:2-hydroxyacid dehydrogenase [Mycolicibacterium mageritense]|uniref:Formate dehydrogenase, mitochondrial n=1 Tax=Mycolicibacterium mageritense TaxID=53462 RepID=A0AAI8TUZ3_MYCME|nr:2-hydroxyacid dehydrogenase [Mycolicibacterium mageritense]TXI66105.1 MAG: phosphoglycerate dehydrogenase [Mycolicibacterium mageritense]BDY29027.1 Formate dehydrogenase, mitochondrial [Mycolicibacterium mageritense]